MPEQRRSLEERVERVAEAALAERSFVTPLEAAYRTHWVSPQLSGTSCSWPPGMRR